MKKIFHHGNISTIFGIFIYLVTQIIVVLIGLRQGNCLSNVFENTFKNIQKENFSPKVALVKNYFQKFNKFHLRALWVSSFLVKL